MKPGLSIPFELITPMATGISIALTYYAYLRGKIRYGIMSQATADKNKAIVAQFLEAVSLKLLLPFFVVESIMRTALGVDVIGAPIIGFLLPATCLIVFALYHRCSTGTVFELKNTEGFQFIVSTFGGGNRGTIFIIMLFGATPYFQDYVKYFSLVDLGNFTFLILVIPWLLKQNFRDNFNDKPSILNNYLFITIVVVIGFIGIRTLALKVLGYDIKMPLGKTLIQRKWLFTALLFAAITLRFKLSRKQFLAVWGFFCAFITVRLICIVLLLIPAVLFSSSADARPAVMILISAIILLCMPPSSILPSMVAHAHAPQLELAEINAITVMFNVFYIFLLIATIVVKIVMSL